jgi:diguanylate cyclase (GGDEF)-like protein
MSGTIRHYIDAFLGARSAYETVVLVLCALTGAVMGTLSLLRALTGAWSMVAIDMAVAVTALAVGTWVWRTGETARASLILAVLFLAGVVVTPYIHGPNMLIWAFPAMATSFALLSPRTAITLNLGAALLMAPKVLAFGAWSEVVSFCAALFVINLFAHAVSTTIDLSQKRLRALSELDPLTQLPNRASLYERIRVLGRTARHERHQLALLLLDIDDFKLVNDTLGHAAGDALLCDVAERLRGCSAGADMVARFGGDEFIILAAVDDADEARGLAERIVEGLSGSFSVRERDIAAHPSIGISLYPRDATTPEDLLKTADMAMYAAKAAGKNRHHFYEVAMNRAVRDRLAIEGQLRQALEAAELLPYFQPRFRLADDALVGAEALLRWAHSERGILEPTAFLGVAEQGPLLGDIDRYVIETVARYAHQWRGAGADLLISVNLSASEVHRSDFADHIGDLLTRDGDGTGIEIEITERTVLPDFERAAGRLRALRERAPGVRVALDDFGTGYSALQYLRYLPIDTLKIDRSFVADLGGGDAQALAIARTIVELGHGIGLRVVAEGAETREQLERLREIGCDEAQGWAVCAPLPVEAFAERFLTVPAVSG